MVVASNDRIKKEKLMKKINETLRLIIPVYNEEEAIDIVINDWTQKLDSLEIDYTICAYNDGSKDQTLRKLIDLAKENKRLKVIDKPNSGHGPTILKGYKDNLDADWLFQIDSDNELRTENFHLLWEAREENDFIIGNRVDRASPLPRVIITQISRWVVGIFYGFVVKDVNMPYRLMRVEKIKEDILRIPDLTFAPNLIVTGVANIRKMRIKQFDITHHSRETGEVSIKKWKLLKAAIQSFWETIKFRFK